MDPPTPLLTHACNKSVSPPIRLMEVVAIFSSTKKTQPMFTESQGLKIPEKDLPEWTFRCALLRESYDNRGSGLTTH